MMTADDSLETFSSGGRRFSISGQQKQSSGPPSQLPDGIHHDNLDTLDDDDDGTMEGSKETVEEKPGIFRSSSRNENLNVTFMTFCRAPHFLDHQRKVKCN